MAVMCGIELLLLELPWSGMKSNRMKQDGHSVLPDRTDIKLAGSKALSRK